MPSAEPQLPALPILPPPSFSGDVVDPLNKWLSSTVSEHASAAYLEKKILALRQLMQKMLTGGNRLDETH